MRTGIVKTVLTILLILAPWAILLLEFFIHSGDDVFYVIIALFILQQILYLATSMHDIGKALQRIQIVGRKVSQIARYHHGKLTESTLALEAGVPLEEARKRLDALAASGQAEMCIDEKDGSIFFEFKELSEKTPADNTLWGRLRQAGSLETAGIVKPALMALFILTPWMIMLMLYLDIIDGFSIFGDLLFYAAIAAIIIQSILFLRRSILDIGKALQGEKQFKRETVRIARYYHGKLTESALALETDVPLKKTRKYLEFLAANGQAEMCIDESDGSIFFEFKDFTGDTEIAGYHHEKLSVDKVEKGRVFQRGTLAGITGLVIAGGIGLAVFLASLMPTQIPATQVPLFNAPVRYDNARDRIIVRLEREGVRATVSPAGIIKVPDTQTARRMRAILAQEDLIPWDMDPWAIFDKERWTLIDFERSVNVRRAITQTLADHIRALDGVDNAHVTIVMPEQSLFASQQHPASASVIITPAPGSGITTNRKAIAGIQRLVRLAVDILQDKNILITDHRGNILNAFIFESMLEPQGPGGVEWGIERHDARIWR